MARQKKNQGEVEQSTPLDIQETENKAEYIEKDEVVMSTNEMIESNKDESQSIENVTVIIKDKRFGSEQQVISKSVYEILKSKGIKIELC